MSDKPTTPGEYVARLTSPARERVQDLRDLATSTAPHLVEQLKWGNPAFLHPDGVIMFIVAAHQGHANVVFTPSTRDAFDERLAHLQTARGAVKLPYADAVPTDLLRQMMEHRVREYEQDGILWK